MQRILQINDKEYPAEWAICGRCSGEGRHDAWEGGMTASEFYEQGPDFAEDYSRGMYDKTCTECGGSGKVIAVAEYLLTAEQRAEVERHYRIVAEMEAERAAEMRMGC